MIVVLLLPENISYGRILKCIFMLIWTLNLMLPNLLIPREQRKVCQVLRLLAYRACLLPPIVFVCSATLCSYFLTWKFYVCSNAWKYLIQTYFEAQGIYWMHEVWPCPIWQVSKWKIVSLICYLFYMLSLTCYMWLLLSRDVRYYEPEHWKFGEVGNKYFRHATGQLYAISKDLATYISINKWDST